MEPTLRELSWMALDAYDSRSRINDTGAPSFADPAVESFFPGWVHQPTGQASNARNADASYASGMDANVYVNAARGQVVIAFRGTEFDGFFQAVGQGDIRDIGEANLDDDILTFFGYYQDDGLTLEDFFDEDGDLPTYLRDTFNLEGDDADTLDDVLDILAELGLDEGVQALARIGEQQLRNQVESALDTVLDVAAANPGMAISVTGHSLGGATAAAVAGALGIEVTLFDPAPYNTDALLDFARDKALEMLAARPGIDPAAFGWDTATAPAELLADSADTYRLEGSFVEGLYLTASPLDLPAGDRLDREIDLGAVLADPFTMHTPELVTLTLDSEIRASDSRPSLETLSTALPGLLARLDNADLVAPGGLLTVEDFIITLLITDPFYQLFADLMVRVQAEVADFAPEGSGEIRGPELEKMLIDVALRGLGQRFADGLAENPGGVGMIFGDPSGAGGPDMLIGAFGRAESYAPGTGRDLIATGAGAADEVRGSFEALNLDTLFDFAPEDSILFTGESFGRGAVSLTDGGRTLQISEGGAVAATIFLGQTADADLITVTGEAGGTRLRLGPSEDGISVEEARDVARIYEAGLGRIADIAGLNFWIDRREAGDLTEVELAATFLVSAEFAELVGEDPDNLDDSEFVGRLYLNILGREGDEDGQDFWEGQLEIEGFGRDDLLLSFAQSAENIADLPAVERLFEVEEGYWDFV
ncbi:hypothetical protein LNKW23_38490 [Paralimibaculum aggregatum]|uniref:DUF4214 domain-containing protein n=1 Tax=Paralimibaculum aggregatum TaxID=3036245 RepID=A0ABQ6LN80_9RHOB|nr:DUF4214 domain-containing protein [Limibaculum sp. NKW23]GMG84633.1 hypothetical protein LNKW23_38490 [Limibaculum sp. NKW23]